MVWRIARREWREWARDGRLLILGGCGFALLLVSVAGGLAATREAARLQAAATADDRAIFMKDQGMNPHNLSHNGRHVYTPTPPLTFLDRGLLDAFGVSIQAEAHTMTGFEYPPTENRTGLARLGDISASGVLQGLVPLLIILLMFTTFAAEREAGTLPQLVAAGVPPAVLLAGKALAGGAIVAAVLALVACSGAAAILLIPSPSPAGQAARLAWLLAAYAAYFATWLGLAIAASAHAKRASSALALLMALWIVAVGVAPRVGAAAAAARHPLPAVADVLRAIGADRVGEGAASGGVNKVSALREALKVEQLKKYKVTRVQDLPFYFEGLLMEVTEARSAESIKRHWGGVWDIYEAQARFLRRCGIASPWLSIQAVSASLSASDIWHVRQFFSSAERYRLALVQALNRDMTEHTRFEGPLYSDTRPGLSYTGREWFTYTASREAMERMPEFAYVEPPVRAALAPQIGAALTLGGWAAAAWMLVWWRTRRIGALAG